MYNTTTSTYTVTDIRKTFESLDADIRTIARRTGKWDMDYVDKVFHDILILAENKYLKSEYLKRKNMLQKELEEKYSDMIEIIEADETGFQSILIKNEYKFDGYNDACHKI